VAKTSLPAKTIFAGTVFSAEKNRFLPVTGKNLPTLLFSNISGWIGLVFGIGGFIPPVVHLC